MPVAAPADLGVAGAGATGRHRRGRGARRTVRPAAHHLRRPHRVRPLARLHRGLHPRPGAPRYANTHTESSGTGLQTTHLREDARQVIHDAVGGTGQDLVIYCGSGGTAAVNKLVAILELREPAGLPAAEGLLDVPQVVPA